jgi:hypothetical protein
LCFKSLRCDRRMICFVLLSVRCGTKQIIPLPHLTLKNTNKSFLCHTSNLKTQNKSFLCHTSHLKAQNKSFRLCF